MLFYLYVCNQLVMEVEEALLDIWTITAEVTKGAQKEKIEYSYNKKGEF